MCQTLHNKFLLIIPFLEFLTSKSLEDFNLLGAEENKRPYISHLKFHPWDLLHNYQRGPGWEKLKLLTRSQPRNNIHQKNPSFAIPLDPTSVSKCHVENLRVLVWTPEQQLTTKPQKPELPLSIFSPQSSGLIPTLHLLAQFKWSISQLHSNRGRSWHHKHIQVATRSRNTSLTADSSPRGWVSSRWKGEPCVDSSAG